MFNKPKVVHCKNNPYTASSTVYIGRPSKWGNPFVMKNESDRTKVIKEYEEYLLSRPNLIEDAKKELKGKNLACWCAPRACHGDILLKIANEE